MRARAGCSSHATPAGPTPPAAACGRTSSPSSPPRRAWRSTPATSRPAPASGTRSSTGAPDEGDYPDGVKVPGERMQYLEDRILDRDPFHGEWNYTVLPAPRPAP